MSYRELWWRHALALHAVVAATKSDPTAHHVWAITVPKAERSNWLSGYADGLTAPWLPPGTPHSLCCLMQARGWPFDPGAIVHLHVWAYHRANLKCAECIAIVEDARCSITQHLWEG